MAQTSNFPSVSPARGAEAQTLRPSTALSENWIGSKAATTRIKCSHAECHHLNKWLNSPYPHACSPRKLLSFLPYRSLMSATSSELDDSKTAAVNSSFNLFSDTIWLIPWRENLLSQYSGMSTPRSLITRMIDSSLSNILCDNN